MDSLHSALNSLQSLELHKPLPSLGHWLFSHLPSAPSQLTSDIALGLLWRFSASLQLLLLLSSSSLSAWMSLSSPLSQPFSSFLAGSRGSVPPPHRLGEDLTPVWETSLISLFPPQNSRAVPCSP